MLVLDEVIPNLYIGDYAASQDLECLRKHNVKCVVAASTYTMRISRQLGDPD